MEKSEATKKAVSEMVKDHKALTTDDVIMMYAILNMYGLDMLKELQDRLNKLMGLYAEKEKYERTRKAVDEVLKL